MKKRTPEDYRDMFLRLQPLGIAWTRRLSSNWAKLWLADGDGFSRLESEVLRLLREANPLYADASLVDWERVTGLPDECSEPGESEETRKAAVIAKLQRPGGQSIDFFLQFLAPFGDIVIVEDDIYPPFQSSVSRAQDRTWELPSGLMFNDDGSSYTDWYYGWRFVWKITRINHIARRFRAGREKAGDHLTVWSLNKLGEDPNLECRINQIKPAHTYVVFEYGSDDEG
jgi:uncharacterized protein YmfQ (DUF2313 family)